MNIFLDWMSGERVRAPELAATWASIRLSIDGDDITVAQEADTKSYRSTVYASAYPLAEWIAFNWWRLTTPGGGRPTPGLIDESRPLALQDAGDGFHWPDVRFKPAEEAVEIVVSAQSADGERLSYKIAGRWNVDRIEFEISLRSFVESVTDRLAQAGIKDTPLQDEWETIHSLSSGEVEFCRAAAAIGEDPFDPKPELRDALLLASEEVHSADLLVEMLAATRPDQALAGARWLGESEQTIATLDAPALTLRLSELRDRLPQRDRRISRRYLDAPWVVGFQRARSLRQLLDLGVDRVEVPSISIARTNGHTPTFVEGLVGVEADYARLIVGKGRSSASERFLQARSLHRSLYTHSFGLHIVADGNSVNDQVERAFAAEFLAPANGIAGAIGHNYSDEKVQAAAKAYSVNVRVIEHQIENQIRS